MPSILVKYFLDKKISLSYWEGSLAKSKEKLLKSVPEGGQGEMKKDLKLFIRQFESELAHEFVRIKKQIDPVRVEPTTILTKLEQQRRFPAVLFENVLNLKHQPTDFKFLMNFCAGENKMNLALGLPQGTIRAEILDEYLRREGKPIEPAIIGEGEAPVKENVLTGKKVDLASLPIIRHHAMETPHFDMVFAGRDLETGRYNLSWHRAGYLDPNHLSVHMGRYHLWHYFNKAEGMKRPLPVAYVLGHHPAFYVASSTTVPLDGPDEYAVAGGVMQEPLRLVPSAVYGKELYIPADAEVVLEGELVPGERVVEGPFGEMSRTYGPQKLSILMEVKAISYQNNPILMSMFSAHPGGAFGVNQAREAGLLKRIRSVTPTVKAVSKWTYIGGAGFIMNIALKKLTEGEQGRAAMAALTDNDIKIVILVDDDIDPYNMGEVMWAVATRMQPHNDVVIMPPMFKGQHLDPSLEDPIRTSAMIIDATKPLDRAFQRTVSIPEKTMERINLEDYIPKEKLEIIPIPPFYPLKSYF
jgi:2,5-furandicarboxylate decarboxylase 1